jgi:ubiquinone/menaquinone biosynthesis C-methylase UbiE
MDPDVAAHYELGHEADRLDTWGRLERERTMALLERHLPPAPARVLDVGGGPGAYAVRLARAGYKVHLVDPVELHVAQAREASAAQPDAPLAGAEIADARGLDAPDASVDAVLLLGPLYHLPDAGDRRRALSEARRVLRPGGVVAVAGISRFASSIDGLVKGHLREEAFERIVEADLREGVHCNPDPIARPEWFTTAFFHRPDELAEEVRAAGFALDAVVAIEGIGAFLPDAGEWLDDPVLRGRLMRAISRVEAEPALVGASPHLLAIGIAPGSG